jgi:hypothetical protein
MAALALVAAVCYACHTMKRNATYSTTSNRRYIQVLIGNGCRLRPVTIDAKQRFASLCRQLPRFWATKMHGMSQIIGDNGEHFALCYLRLARMT